MGKSRDEVSARAQVHRVRMGENMGENQFFSRDPEAAFGSESATNRGPFWIRTRWAKAVTRWVLGPRFIRSGWARTWVKTNSFLGIQKQRLAAKVRPIEARFGPIFGGNRSCRLPALKPSPEPLAHSYTAALPSRAGACYALAWQRRHSLGLSTTPFASPHLASPCFWRPVAAVSVETRALFRTTSTLPEANYD